MVSFILFFNDNLNTSDYLKIIELINIVIQPLIIMIIMIFICVIAMLATYFENETYLALLAVLQ